jgi:tetratricopeptide (TPR) repeat protein
MRSRLAQGLAAAGRALPFWQREVAVRHRARGIDHAKAEDWSAAADAYREALTIDDSVAGWHYTLASVLANAEDWRGAASAYRAAVARDDSHAEWHARLAVALARLEDSSGAAEALRAALARDDSNPAWHYRLGVMLGRLDDWEGAAAAYEAAVARDAGQAAWHHRLGYVRAKLKDWDEAIAAYEAALAIDDGNAAWHAHLGMAFTRKARWAEAAVAYRAAIARDGDHASWYRRLGLVLERVEDWQGAAEAYRASLALRADQGKHEEDRSRIGVCLGQHGDDAAATAVLAPLIAEADGHLAAFMRRPAIPVDWTRAALFLPGTFRTLLARKVVSGSQDRVYFEQLKPNCARSRRLAAFHGTVNASLGDDIPRQIPRLRHSASCARYRYFLYDHVDGDSDLFPIYPGDAAELDESLGRRIAGTLVEVSSRLDGLFDRDVRVWESARGLPHAAVETYLAGEIRRSANHDTRRAALRKLSDRWPALSARLEAAPEVLCHGDVHGGNLIAATDGRLRVVDWESYGWATVGYDLVTLYRRRFDRPELEDLIDLYFDGLAPEIGADERRAIIALLMVISCCETAAPLPERWLDVLA